MLDINQKKVILIWRFDYKTQFFTCSYVQETHNKENKDEILSMDDWMNHIHLDDRIKTRLFFEDCIHKKTPYHDEYRMMFHNTFVYVHISSRIDYTDQKAIGLLGTIEDITREKILSLNNTHLLKSYEASLNDLKHELQQSQQKILDTTSSANRFISTLSHEIRTPMNAMIGFIELLNQTPVNDEQSTYIERIKSASEHLLSIVNDILDLTKIESGKMKVEKYSFDLIQLIDDVKMLLHDQIQKKRLYVDIEYMDCPKRLIGDRLRIHQVLINLLSNAIKFTDIGGISLIISSYAINHDDVRVDIVVKDTGIGMTKEQQSRLFDEFEQADQKTTRLYGGTGLGLPISKKLIELMGGSIRLESMLNEGTTFTVSLPLIIDHNEVDEKPTFLPTTYRKNAHILVAEDHVLSQKLVERMLINCGMHVSLVSNGKDAISLLEKGVYDLVLMDIEMPILNGIDATRFIRKFNNTPIIALTGHIYADEHAKILLSGMNDILVKPITLASLNAILSKWIPDEV